MATVIKRSGHAKNQARNKSTFANQNTLPRLPVPLLTRDERVPNAPAAALKVTPTLPRWLRSIEPLTKGEELAEAKRVTADFGKPGGLGEKLSADLRARASQFPDSSWLAKWWMSYAYMGYRESILINVSYSYIFDSFPHKATQSERAADLARAFITQMILIQKEQYPPDEIRGVPQCMSSYKNMFGTCRIPAKPDDYLVAAKPEDARHIVVACKNLFYALKVVDSNGEPLSRDSIEAGLRSIQEDAANKVGTQPAVGILTTQHRDTWTDVRQEMLKDPLNQASLKTIETAAFVLTLDDYTPTTEEDLCKTLLHGKGAKYSSSNRFYDKGFNVVIFPNGEAGFTGEHSGLDGYPVTMVTDAVWEDAALKQHLGGSTAPCPPAKLLEYTPSSSLKKHIEEAVAFHDKNVASVDMTLTRFDAFGTKFIKTAGVSPDGFVQMAFQLAYHRLHNAFSPVYESCSTRQYLHGRTEVGRSLSNECVEFVNAMDNPIVSLGAKYDIFKKACETHIAYIREATDGYGCDRHILGMKFLAKEQGLDHPFFHLPAHGKTTNWTLSTSQLPSKHSITGFGPVVPNGYGIYYNLRNAQLNFHISSFNTTKTTDAYKLSSTLKQALLDLQAMCSAATAQTKL